MDVRDGLRQVARAAEASVDVPLVEEIERRASRRRRAAKIKGGLAILIFAAALGGGAKQFLRPFAEPGIVTSAPNQQFDDGALSGQSSAPPACDVDDCGEGKPLEHGEDWLASILNRAGLEYEQQYRADGGGGHLVREWEMFISALPPQSDPGAWALSHEYEAIWETNGVTIYSSYDKGDRIGYFYWQAGGVDSLVQVAWSSRVSQPKDIQGVLERIVREQELHEYGDNP